MLVVLLIFLVGLAPACISAWYTWTADRSAKTSGGRAVPAYGRMAISQPFGEQGDLHYVDGLGYMIGDITCDLNAHSPYLRCAINPIGPCDGCQAYSPKIFDRQV
ncbi:MAG: DUF6464 family protein [Nodosilinea sp.]|jgi:hypothetical protein